MRGSLRSLNFGKWDASLDALVGTGMERYLWSNRILFKDYHDYVKSISDRVRKASVKPCEDLGRPVAFLRSPHQDKDETAVLYHY